MEKTQKKVWEPTEEIAGKILLIKQFKWDL